MGISRKIRTDIYVVDEFIIDGAEVAQKYITLSKLPSDLNAVAVDVQGGTSQKSLVDFQVIGQTVSWIGLGLEVQIGIGDFLRVTYT